MHTTDRTRRSREPATSLAVAHLFDLSIEFARMDIVPTVLGTRMIAVVGSGTFEGPTLRGTVEPGSGDWLLVGGDDIARLDIRSTLTTDAGARVYMTAAGRVRLTPDARDRFLSGDAVLEPEMIGRATPLFETIGPPVEALNGLVTLGVIQELALDHIIYRVYAFE